MTKRILKTAFSFILAISLIISAASVLAAAGGTGSELYTNTTELADGFFYTNTISYNSSSNRVETFSLEASPQSGIYPIVMACDTIYGGMTITQIVSYAESQGYNVVGAVNADFFSTSYKIPLGAVIENGEYKSSPSGENVLAFGQNGAFVSKAPQITINLYNNGGGEYIDTNSGSIVSNAGKTVELQHLNKMRTETGGLYLYTSAFSTVSTRTTTAGWAVRMRILSGSMSVSGEMTLEVAEVIPEGTSYQIGDGYVVLTASAACGMSAELQKFSVGDIITLTTVCSDSSLVDAQWASGCGDILVSEGSITDTAAWDSDLFGAQPRTAVGIKSDGSIICYVVDGRSSSYSNGAKMSEIAAELIARGCEYVVNMDGGGSSAMAVKLPGTDSCAVVNNPSDGSARSCASYILFVTDNVSDGAADRLFLKNDGIYVLAGSSVELSYLASDSSSSPASLPEEITAVSGGLGSISENIYTAGSSSGDDKILLSSPSGASGFGTIHIVTSADKLTVTDASTSKAPVLSNLDRGDTVQLNVSLSLLSRNVALDQSAVSYTVTGDIGSISADGVFTASGTPGSSGTITVSAGGLEYTLSVSLKTKLLDIDGHWAESYIDALFSSGIVEGTGNLLFKPNDSIKRCDFVLMMWRAMGKPESTAECTFSDVPADSYYTEAVAWAESVGITNGSGGGKFDPLGLLNRDQAFTLVYRLLNYAGKELPEADRSALDAFTDGAEVSDFAADAVSSLIIYGMIEGSGGKLSPLNQISRAEMAKVLYIAIS
ncbi:MAG: phosphodiester glycosidase family protein [Oscillospiraceae bacterium]